MKYNKLCTTIISNALCCVGQRSGLRLTPSLAEPVIFILGIRFQFSAGITGMNRNSRLGPAERIPTSGPDVLTSAQSRVIT